MSIPAIRCGEMSVVFFSLSVGRGELLPGSVCTQINIELTD